MEQKKTQRADIDQRRTTGFLLGLTFVLALFYVTLEWNAITGNDGFIPLDMNEMVHESDLFPMSNVETMSQMIEKKQIEKVEQLRVVDDNVEVSEPEDEELEGEAEGDDDEALLKELEQSMDDDMALASLGIDPNNPLNFHVAEELPQFPGGAVEFMKWLTKHLRYPDRARQQKVQGKVVAVFYVEKDGNISGMEARHPERPSLPHQGVHTRGLQAIAPSHYPIIPLSRYYVIPLS